jgi:hypothetical protein
MRGLYVGDFRRVKSLAHTLPAVVAVFDNRVTAA